MACDWSMSSPAIALYDDGKITYHAFKKKKFHENIQCEDIFLYDYPENLSGIALYDFLAEWAKQFLPCDFAFIESIAFGAKGNICGLSECVALLKHEIWRSNTPFDTFTPLQVKACAIGLLKAEKTRSKTFMYDAFVKDTGKDIFHLFVKNAKKIPSPLNDIVDAHFILKLGMKNFHCKNLKEDS